MTPFEIHLDPDQYAFWRVEASRRDMTVEEFLTVAVNRYVFNINNTPSKTMYGRPEIKRMNNETRSDEEILKTARVTEGQVREGKLQAEEV